MPLFEVFIPTTDPDGFNITARIRADSWIQALRNGLAKLGESADVRNIMCDIKENSIDVTEPASGRVFRIRELAEEAAPAPAAAAPAPAAAAPAPAAAAPAPAAAAPAPAAAAPAPAAPPVASRSPVASAPPPVASAPPPVASAPPPAAVAPPPAAVAPPPAAVAPPPAAVAPPVASAPPAAVAPPPVAVAPPPAASASQRAASAAPRAAAAPPASAPPAAPLIPSADRFQPIEEETVTQEKASDAEAVVIGRAKEEEQSIEDLITDLFDATQSMHDHADLRDAARYVLNLAMETIPSDSGAVFISDINRDDLYFAAAAGPKADDVMSFRVPMGQGIVGFSAQAGVSLAVSDVHRDPRFYATISKAIGYETHSIVCSPAQQGGRVFGAIELINKKSGSSYTGDEVNILNYLAHAFADYLITTGQTGD